MSKNSTVFRTATAKMTIAGKTERFYFLEIIPDGWINTNRLCDSREDAERLQNESGHGKEKKEMLAITFATRYLRLTADPGSLEIFDPC